MERENASLQKQIDYLRQRTQEIDGQRRMSSNKQSQLMKLITSTAPVVLDSLKATGNEEQPAPLQALISKLNEAIEEDEASGPKTEPQPQQTRLVSTTVQTANPNMKFF